MLAKSEVVASARKLVRTFASAPDPRRQARLIHATLLQAEPWPSPLQERIAGFGAWLESFPPVGELRARCAELVSKFPDANGSAPSPSSGPARRG